MNDEAASVDRTNLARQRFAFVAALTVVTGVADAIGFIHLGAFSSVMTGNMIMFGISIGSWNLATLFVSAAAIIGYALGAAAGTRAAGPTSKRDPFFPAGVLTALIVELAVIIVFVALWQLLPKPFSTATATGLLFLVAAAMGILSSAVVRFGVPGLSSTYMTGTLTGVIGAVATRKPWTEYGHSFAILCCLVLGVCLGTVVVRNALNWAPVLLLVGLLLMTLVYRQLHRREQVEGTELQ